MAVLLDCGGLSVSEVAASEYGLITMTIAFALSGGSSLGSVQVGMMQALADQGISPDLVVGTSAGAINAVWVAGGRPLDELAELWHTLGRCKLTEEARQTFNEPWLF